MREPPHDPIVRTSRFLSLVLRHRPELAGLVLGDGGWVSVDELLAGCARAGRTIDRELLHRVVAENDKQRFALSPDGRRIRANQGHSVAVDLQLEPRTPPPVLWHGTHAAAVSQIRREGLRRGRRHHVHLSADVDTARRVGGRRGAAVVLTVDSAGMHAAGALFWRSENGVWLCSAVEPRWLTFPPTC